VSVEAVVEPVVAELVEASKRPQKKPTKLVASTDSATGEPISEN